ncbi:transcriptional regulator family: GATA type zinc finger [Penicillium herquei]|nr:transcriptional regulator family: GATA type zinc finger [Penicillium herquei]
MSAASEFANTDEATEPLDTSISRPDTYAASANQSASSMREKLARHFEPGILNPGFISTQLQDRGAQYDNVIDINSMIPGDTKATSRRFSDIPTSVNEFRTHQLNEGIEEPGEEVKESALGSVHEIVAKALGGGSRGGS